MPEQLLTILKFCLIALLYLFFLRVLRVVWTEVREPASAGASVPRPAATAPPRPQKRRRAQRVPDPTRLVMIAPPQNAGGHYTLAPEMTIGRAPGCTIVIEDGYVSSVHTRVFGRDGSWLVEDLGSTNGTYLNQKKVTGPSVLRVGDHISVGNVELEVR